MAHQRPRHLQAFVTKLLKFSPIIGVLGHRQVGKTTLLTHIAKEYKTLDLQHNRQSAALDPMSFLAALKQHPSAIDEVQHCPELFPALKEWVRTHKKPGQFILSGSVRFTSKRAIRESLTGRIVNLELLPFSQSELDEREINSTPLNLITQDLSQYKPCLDAKTITKRHEHLMQYAKKGGLPGLCFIRDETVRTNQIETNLQTILDRDLRLIYETNLRYATMRLVLTHLATIQGNPVNLADISRKTRVSVPTLKNLVQAFENLFLIRQIPSLGGAKTQVVFMEDQGEAAFLNDQPYDTFSTWLRVLYANVRVAFLLKPEWRPQFFQFRTRGGAYMPLAVKTDRGILGFSISLERNPSESTLKSSLSFIKKFPKSRVCIVTPFAQHEVVNKNILISSFGEIL